MNKKHTENVVFPFVSDNNDHCSLSRLPAVGCSRLCCLICHFSRPPCSSWCDASFDLPTWFGEKRVVWICSDQRKFGLSGWHTRCKRRWRERGISNWLVLLAWLLSFSLVYPSCKLRAHHYHVRMLWLVYSTSRGCDVGFFVYKVCVVLCWLVDVAVLVHISLCLLLSAECLILFIYLFILH